MQRLWLAPMLLAATLSGCGGGIGAIGFPAWGRSGSTAAAPPPPPPVYGAPGPTDAGAQVASAQGGAPGYPGGQSAYPGYGGAATPAAGAPGFGNAAPPAGEFSGGTTLAAAPAAANQAAIGRTDLLGGWTIASGPNSCQLFMTLTTWTGGYRASTRGCNSEPLKSISAWNLDGPQVILAGQGGAPVARLGSTGQNRFDGQTQANAAISFYR